MKNRVNKILLICSALLFLIIFPYTRQIERFKAEDVTWKLISGAVNFKQFDPKVFSFRDTYFISKELKELNNKKIIISGFIKQHKHHDHIDIVLNETVTDVCFMCDHDEHFGFIHISPKNSDQQIKHLGDDVFVKLRGTFIINEQKGHSVFHLRNAELVKIISKN